jgi:hypothetical protein
VDPLHQRNNSPGNRNTTSIKRPWFTCVALSQWVRDPAANTMFARPRQPRLLRTSRPSAGPTVSTDKDSNMTHTTSVKDEKALVRQREFGEVQCNPLGDGQMRNTPQSASSVATYDSCSLRSVLARHDAQSRSIVLQSQTIGRCASAASKTRRRPAALTLNPAPAENDLQTTFATFGMLATHHQRSGAC